MKKLTVFLIPVLLLVISCSEDKDELPVSYLNGTYELAYENTDRGLWYIDQLNFSSNGKITRQGLVRIAPDGADLGWYSYSEGNYSVRGEEYRVDVESIYQMEFESEEFYVPLEELVLLEDYNPGPQVGNLRQEANGQIIAISFPCNDMFNSGVNLICLGEQKYAMVN